MPENSKTDLVFIYTTFPDEAVAQRTCKAIIGNRLAACANIFPAMTAIYEWQGNLETEQECAVYLKTLERQAEELMKTLREMHPYDTPAIVEIPVSSVDKDYLAWVTAQTGAPNHP